MNVVVYRNLYVHVRFYVYVTKYHIGFDESEHFRKVSYKIWTTKQVAGGF